MVSFKLAPFPSQYHLHWHVSKNSVNTSSPRRYPLLRHVLPATLPASVDESTWSASLSYGATRTCTRGSGRLVMFQRRVNDAKMVRRRKFILSRKKCSSDVSVILSRQIATELLKRRILALQWQKRFITDASISTSVGRHPRHLVVVHRSRSSTSTQIHSVALE